MVGRLSWRISWRTGMVDRLKWMAKMPSTSFRLFFHLLS